MTLWEALVRLEHRIERIIGLHPPPDPGTASAPAMSSAPAPAAPSATPASPPTAAPDSGTPSVASNPPPPAGYRYMPQSMVTAEMAGWSASVLHDTGSYPMGATTTRDFDGITVLARVEWHPADAHIPRVHRGVSLFTVAS